MKFTATFIGRRRGTDARLHQTVVIEGSTPGQARENLNREFEQISNVVLEPIPPTEADLPAVDRYDFSHEGTPRAESIEGTAERMLYRYGDASIAFQMAFRTAADYPAGSLPNNYWMRVGERVFVRGGFQCCSERRSSDD